MSEAHCGYTSLHEYVITIDGWADVWDTLQMGAKAGLFDYRNPEPVLSHFKDVCKSRPE